MNMVFTLAAMAEAACGVFIAPAGVASAEPSAIGTIGQLEAQGYSVNIGRIGSGPLSTCVVTSVRNPQTVTRLIRVDNGGRHGGRHGDGPGSRSWKPKPRNYGAAGGPSCRERGGN